MDSTFVLPFQSSEFWCFRRYLMWHKQTKKTKVLRPNICPDCLLRNFVFSKIQVHKHYKLPLNPSLNSLSWNITFFYTTNNHRILNLVFTCLAQYKMYDNKLFSLFLYFCHLKLHTLDTWRIRKKDIWNANDLIKRTWLCTQRRPRSSCYRTAGPADYR